MRKYRKREHVENFLRTNYVGNPLFEDIFLYHNSLPEFNFNDIDTSTEFLGKKVNFPLMINAMTGGTEFSREINISLAKIAKHYNIPMAVGSQTIALEDGDAEMSFQCVREIMPEGVIVANLNGHASVEDAKKAIDLIKADGIQIHLNPAQELAMEEGDRDFSDVLKNISKIVRGVEVPVIVKEVGFGISKEVARQLYSVGVKHIDIAGFGGTNFFEVENLRNPNSDLSELYGWGIPTAMSLIELNALEVDDLKIISSGGVKSSLDIVKSLAVGCEMVGMSGEILSYLIHGGYDYTVEFIDSLIYKSKMIMLLTGAKNIEEVGKLRYNVTGKLRELVDYDK